MTAPLGAFEAIRDLTVDAPLPPMLRVRQHFDAPEEPDPGAAAARALEPLRNRLRPGMRVALTGGSRGIHDAPTVLRAAAAWLRDAGADPFLAPAMGSHGGATADGQIAMLAKLGMTEDSVGVPVHATMDTVDLGGLEGGGPTVHLGRELAEADGILVVNRVKAHTDFRGAVESGLAKMTAIGMGKQRGAEAMHAYGPANLATWVPRAVRRIAETGKLLGGLAILENAFDRTAKVAFVEPGGIGDDAEAALLDEARRLMARLPFDALDVLVVDAMGKNKSGTGMDTNVLGRIMIRGSEEFPGPRITNVVALELTAASNGNAVGIGLADFVPLRLVERADLRTSYINAMTAGLAGVQRAQIPMVLPTDRDAVAAAIQCCGRADAENVRLVRIRDTLDLEELLVSASLRQEVSSADHLELLGEDGPLRFDDGGTVAPWPEPVLVEWP